MTMENTDVFTPSGTPPVRDEPEQIRFIELDVAARLDRIINVKYAEVLAELAK